MDRSPASRPTETGADARGDAATTAALAPDRLFCRGRDLAPVGVICCHLGTAFHAWFGQDGECTGRRCVPGYVTRCSVRERVSVCVAVCTGAVLQLSSAFRAQVFGSGLLGCCQGPGHSTEALRDFVGRQPRCRRGGACVAKFVTS